MNIINNQLGLLIIITASW